jgi:transketolase
MLNMAMREAYGIALADYGEINPEIVVLDADTSSSTLSHFFASRFPDRFYNVGIAEQCLIDVGVGLALGGKIPFINAFAALAALRGLEPIRTCVCYARTNVKIAASYAGLSDFKDGPTHHAITDIALMRALPGMTVIVPADSAEASSWVPVIAEYDGPIYLRLSRAATTPVHPMGVSVAVGRGIKVREGKDVTLVACGSMVGRCVAAADSLEKSGISTCLLEFHTIKPLDIPLLIQTAEETAGIVTVEEHSIVGGLGGAVAEALSETLPKPVVRVGIADTFTRTAPDPESLMDAYGLSVEAIVQAAHRALIISESRHRTYAG